VIYVIAKILVVDDDLKTTSLLTRALSFEGYTVQAANKGVKGLQIAREWHPELVILDTHMAKMDGWEVCRKLRMVSDVPIIMISRKDDVSDRVRGFGMGADDYLKKPFALEELFARIRSILRRQWQLIAMGRKENYYDDDMWGGQSEDLSG